MILIGSRAIRYHFPEFREPLDWDLVGTDEEIAALDGVLPRAGEQRPEKAHFRYGQVMVEVASATALPYWELVTRAFANEPIIHEPTLGALRVAPAAYLLLTKHCGLIYPVVHWHKNLEDLYFMRERVTHIPDDIAALLPETLSDSHRMFHEVHQRRIVEVNTCHPTHAHVGPHHARLHAALALGPTAAVSTPGAWEGFPALEGADKKRQLRVLLAEEAMVVAAERQLRPELALSEDDAALARWALRMLAIGNLPESFRYFLVNHYREIRDLIPADFLTRVRALDIPRSVGTNSCARETEGHNTGPASAPPRARKSRAD
jgi:hypothetical protein